MRELIFNLVGVCGGIYALEKDFPELAKQVRALELCASEFVSKPHMTTDEFEAIFSEAVKKSG